MPNQQNIANKFTNNSEKAKYNIRCIPVRSLLKGTLSKKINQPKSDNNAEIGKKYRGRQYNLSSLNPV